MNLYHGMHYQKRFHSSCPLAGQNMLLFEGGKHILASMLGECPIFQKYQWWANQMAPSEIIK
jgi:hypothetical protein